MRIAVLDGYTSNPGDLSWEAFEKLGELTVYDRTKPEEVVSRCAGCEVVFTNKVVMDAGIMDQLPDLKYIGVLATGTNVIDFCSIGIGSVGNIAYSFEVVVNVRYSSK